MKQNLVVIGNGMAGARTVEEILSRGGAEKFNITMFGDEPYGNYNRILLSNVLNGIDDEKDIFLNPLAWYVDNQITLHAGMRAKGILRRAKVVIGADGRSEPYDKLIIATGSRAFIPAIAGLEDASGKPKPGVFVFRSLDDCRKIASYAAGQNGRAVVIGGGFAWPRSSARAAKLRHGSSFGAYFRSPDGSAAGSAGFRHPEDHCSADEHSGASQ